MRAITGKRMIAMNRFLLALPAAVACAAFTLGVPAPAVAEQHEQHEKSTLVTILTAPHPETQLMAMTLTLQSLQQGADVRVLLCGPAGDLALQEPPASATQPQKPADMSPQGVLEKIIEAGAPVDVCAIYLPNKDLGADALLEGVGQARPDAMAAHLLGPDTRILSF
jgi:hypothetical protein